MMQSTSSTPSVFARGWHAVFGQRDEVAKHLHEIERQGGFTVSLGHFLAGLTVILFSLGSLVALSSDPLNRLLASIAAGGLDIPAAITVAVSFLMVVCCDTAMLLAALVLRLLSARHAPWSERMVHIALIVWVCILEGGTYIYMSAIYDGHAHLPAWVLGLSAWLLIFARGLTVPVVAVYLAMARRLGVSVRDILHHTELAAGGGVIRDTVRVAHKPDAPMAAKVGLYAAAALANETDKGRLKDLLKASRRMVDGRGLDDDEDGEETTGRPDGASYTPPGMPRPRLPAPRTPHGPYPTGGGTPGAVPFPTYPTLDDDTFPGWHSWESAAERRSDQTATVVGQGVDDDVRKQARQEALWASAKVLLDAAPWLSKTALREELECRQEWASGYLERWLHVPGNRARREAAKAAQKRAKTVARESADEAPTEAPALTHPVAQ